MPFEFPENNSENKVEVPKWKRIPVTVDSIGEKKNVWVNYIVEMKPMEGTCIECGEESEVECESVKKIKVESENEDEIRQAEEKIRELVKKHEQKMFVCKDCFDDDFLSKRTELYIKSLEEAQDELGIEVDKNEQRKNILNN